MRFSHTADCHLGGHRDPTLRALGVRAFERFVTESITQNVDFVLIAGDLFNTAIPGIDALKVAVTSLSTLREAKIPVYAIGGSHDASPTGKSMLDVLERAGLLVDVGAGKEDDERWTPRIVTDPKTGYHITGVPGRAGMLDRQLWERFDRAMITEPSKTILLAHTAIAGFHDVPGAVPSSLFPPGCAYYACGHVHEPGTLELPGVGMIAYPGPLFPNSFDELETLQNGGYLLVEQGRITKKPITLARVVRISIDASGHAARDIPDIVRERLAAQTIAGAIITLRVSGKLTSGEPQEIELRDVVRDAQASGAIALLRHTVNLSFPAFEYVDVDELASATDAEDAIIAAHRDQLTLPDANGELLARTLLSALAKEMDEGEKQYVYRDRVIMDGLRVIDDTQNKEEKRKE